MEKIISNTVEDYLNGEWPECEKSKKGTHTLVRGMNVKPHCLWCDKPLVVPSP